MKKILFISRGGNHPSGRFRIEQYLPYFKKQGNKFLILNLPPYNFWKSSMSFWEKVNFATGLVLNILSKLLILPLLPFYDIVFIQRGALLGIILSIEKLYFLLNKKVILDFDDTIPPEETDQSNWLKKIMLDQNRTDQMIKRARCIIVGNKYLAQYAKKLNKKVIILSTPVETKNFRPRENRKIKKQITIGWVGTSSNLKYLEALLPVLQKIEKIFKNVEIITICDEQSKILTQHLKRYRHILWNKEEEIKNFHRIDIGIMPLVENEWTKGKCGFKLLQYMACGIPTVASPVGINKKIIRDGFNGFLAKENEEWFKKLSFLIKNKKTREKNAKAARKTVCQSYSTAKNFEKLKKIIDSP